MSVKMTDEGTQRAQSSIETPFCPKKRAKTVRITLIRLRKTIDVLH